MIWTSQVPSASLAHGKASIPPIDFIEALASGVPVVSTDVGGVNHVVTHERTALLIPSGDPDAMAAALLRVIDDPELASPPARQRPCRRRAVHMAERARATLLDLQVGRRRARGGGETA